MELLGEIVPPCWAITHDLHYLRPEVYRFEKRANRPPNNPIGQSWQADGGGVFGCVMSYFPTNPASGSSGKSTSGMSVPLRLIFSFRPGPRFGICGREPKSPSANGPSLVGPDGCAKPASGFRVNDFLHSPEEMSRSPGGPAGVKWGRVRDTFLPFIDKDLPSRGGGGGS